MSKYSSIYKYVEKRKALAKKLLKLDSKVQHLREQCRELQSPFWGGDIDVDLYKDFFKHYCIRLTNADKSYCQYKVTDIMLDTQATPNAGLFWKAVYEYKEYDSNNTRVDWFIGSLSLRKILKLMLQPGASFQKI